MFLYVGLTYDLGFFPPKELRKKWFTSPTLTSLLIYILKTRALHCPFPRCRLKVSESSRFAGKPRVWRGYGYTFRHLLFDSPGKHSEGSAELGQLYWPNTSTLTTRLRRLITAYQRSYKRQQMRQEALMKTDRRRRRPREEVRALEAEREAIISEKRQK